MYKNISNISLLTLFVFLIQSIPVIAQKSTVQDNRSFKEKSDDFAFSICVRDISKDSRAIKAVTGVTTVSSFCGCLKSEMNLLVDDQLATNLGVAFINTEKQASLTEEDKNALSDWMSKYSASLGGCFKKISQGSK